MKSFTKWKEKVMLYFEDTKHQMTIYLICYLLPYDGALWFLDIRLHKAGYNMKRAAASVN